MWLGILQKFGLKQKLILGLVIILFLIGAVYLFLKKQPTDSDGQAQGRVSVVEEPVKPIIKEEKMSRISFFNQSPYIGSINIPESWEGKYRLRENADNVKILYIGMPDQEVSVLEIRRYSPGAESSISVSEAILEKVNGFIFTLAIPEANPFHGEPAAEYGEMIKQAKDLAETFKIVQR